MFDAGVDSPLDELLLWVRSVVGSVDVDELEVPVAARVVEQCAEAERLLAASPQVPRFGYRHMAAWHSVRLACAPVACAEAQHPSSASASLALG